MSRKGGGIRRKPQHPSRKGPKRRTWLKRLTLLIILAPVIGVLILNLTLATSWGTGLVSKRITAHTGLPCQIDRISWWPWSGGTVSGFHLNSPKPSASSILTIREVNIDLSWRSLLAGKKRFERLEVREVRGSLSLEQLRDLLGSSRIPPALPEASPTPESIVPPDDSAPPALADNDQPNSKPTVNPSDRQSPADPASNRPPPAKSPTPKAVPPIAPVDDFEGLIVLSDIDLELYSEKEPRLSISLNGIAGELPIWGPERSGTLSISSILVGGELEERGLTLPVQWRDRYLRTTDHPMKLFGLNFNLSTAIRFVSGLPVGLQIDVPAQQMDLSPMVQGESPISLRSVTSSSRLQGYLLHPRSFNGQSHSTFAGLVINDPRDGSENHFDRGNFTARLSPAGLIVSDARAIGEEEAFLGNGFVTTSGEAAATLRIVASPERARNHQNRVAEAGLDFAFTDLVTPDRLYRDLRLEARQGTIMIDLGPDEQWVPLLPATRAILKSGPPAPSILP